jgi:hypothetical protein
MRSAVHRPSRPQVRRVAVRTAPWALLLGLLGAGADGCKSREIPEGQCVFNTDCDDGLVCAGRYCRQACNPDPSNGRNPDRDCPTGWRCLSSGEQGRSVCLPPGENGFCVYHSDCREPYVCTRDGRCSDQCRADRDCERTVFDPGAQCVFVNDVGVCDFRDAGPRPDVSATLPDSGASLDAGSPR